MAEPTKTHPFFQSPFTRHGGASNRRRSTRLDLALPVVISGRDAKGEPFRDETQTETVNLHGAKVRTSREILVGMLVTVENPILGAVEKAVCVRIYPGTPGEAAHSVALQLVRPGNIWGVENPPQDWAAAAAEMLGAAARPQRAAPAAPAKPPVEPAMLIVESQAVSVEQQVATLTEAVLQTFRQQIGALANAALQDFENRMKVIEGEAQVKFDEHVKESMRGASSVLDAMREDAAAQMASTAAEAAATVEAEVRAKVAELLAPLANLGSHVGPR